MAAQRDTTNPSNDPVSADQVIHLVKPVQSKVSASLEGVLEPLKLTPAQFRILSAVAERQSASTADLARELGLSPQGMAKQIAALEVQNRLRRKARENNRRTLDLELTPEGRMVLSASHVLVQQLQEQLLVGFTAEERSLLRTFLWRILGGRYASRWLNQGSDGDGGANRSD